MGLQTKLKHEHGYGVGCFRIGNSVFRAWLGAARSLGEGVAHDSRKSLTMIVNQWDANMIDNKEE